MVLVLDADDPREHTLLHTSHDAPVAHLDFAPARVRLYPPRLTLPPSLSAQFGNVLLSADVSGVVHVWSSRVLALLSACVRASLCCSAF